jgi:alpha-mannosidase
MRTVPALAALSLLVPCAAHAVPTAAEAPDALVVTGPGYQLRVLRERGVFEYLVDPEGDGSFVSLMRPGGEMGWFGYNYPAGLDGTYVAPPEIAVTNHPRGVTVTARTVLSAARGVTHTAQYDCLDSCVVLCSRYEGEQPPGGAGLVRIGPKLDVDIGRLTDYVFHDAEGKRHAGTLGDKTRDAYFGTQVWGAGDGVSELSAALPYEMLLSGETGAKLAVVYPFFADLWFGRTKFLQLYHDGGNYWYTGTGAGSSFGTDTIVCLASDGTKDEVALEARLPAILSDAQAAVANGEVKAVVTPRPRPQDGPLYLLSYDHAVGYPKIQEEARRSVASLDAHPELRIGLQAEGWTWDWLAENDPAFVAEAREWIAKYAGRWVPGGGSYGQPYFTFVSEESGIRQMLYGTRAIREHLGYENSVYVYSEHETMPQLPQILAGMGYRGAFFRTHMGYGGDGPSKDADWVRWIGPDGSAIPAVPAYSGREHAWGNEWLTVNYLPGIYWYTGAPMTWSDMDSFKVEMLARGVHNPIVSRCEDWYTRPSEELLRDAKAHEAEHTEWVTAEGYFDILERSGIAPVDFAAGANDFQPVQPWGYSGNRTWTGPRVASSSALTAEALAALAMRQGFAWDAEHQKRLDGVWKDLLIAEHHDSLICAIYNEGRDFTDPSLAASKALSEELAGFVAGKADATGASVFVMNPTGHTRTEAVRLSDGAWLLARDLPPMGYRVLPRAEAVSPALAPEGQRTLETDRFEVEFASEGGIARLRDKALGRDLTVPGTRTGLLRGQVGSEDATSTGSVRVAASGPQVWEAVEEGRVGTIPYTLTYRFVRGVPRIDLDIRLDVAPGTRIGCPEDKGTPEERRNGQFRDHSAKLRYIVGTTLEQSGVVRHQPLTIAEMPAGSETVDANLWASLETAGVGLAMANRGSMGYRAVGGGLEAILAYSGEYVWGDRFLDGVYDYDLSLIPYAGTPDRGRAHAEALAFDRPAYALEFEGAGGTLAREGSALVLPEGDPEVTVLSVFPQDGRWFVRLCNMGDEARSLEPAGLLGETSLALGPARPLTGALALHPWRAQTYELAP